MTNATEVRERPILFSGPMVRAILAGDKTQTRRVVTFRRPKELCDLPIVEYARDGMPIWWDSPPPQKIRDSDYYDQGKPCPYGRPGDCLWVRETFVTYREDSPEEAAKKSAASEAWCKSPSMEGLVDFAKLPGRSGPERALYAADFAESLECVDWTWRPSIHMPRWASRLTLEITDVRVQRLQEISELDARDEGVEVDVFDQTIGAKNYLDGSWFVEWEEGTLDRCHRDSFRTLWDSINAAKHPWESNPWVWAVTFKRVH